MGNLHKIRRVFWKIVAETGQPPNGDCAGIRYYRHQDKHSVEFYGGWGYKRHRGFVLSLKREYAYRLANGLLDRVAHQGYGLGRDRDR